MTVASSQPVQTGGAEITAAALPVPGTPDTITCVSDALSTTVPAASSAADLATIIAPLSTSVSNTPSRRQQSKQRVRREPWAESQDEALGVLVKEIGMGNWPEVAKRLAVASPDQPQRTGKQCRERWHNHLAPSVVKEDFSPEEDAGINAAVEELGPKWAVIVKRFPGRTDNGIKNRWNSMRRKRERAVEREARVAAKALTKPPKEKKLREPKAPKEPKRRKVDERAAEVLVMWQAASALQQSVVGGDAGTSSAAAAESASSLLHSPREAECDGTEEELIAYSAVEDAAVADDPARLLCEADDDDDDGEEEEEAATVVRLAETASTSDESGRNDDGEDGRGTIDDLLDASLLVVTGQSYSALHGLTHLLHAPPPASAE